jgi:hypothetical protein
MQNISINTYISMNKSLDDIIKTIDNIIKMQEQTSNDLKEIIELLGDNKNGK